MTTNQENTTRSTPSSSSARGVLGSIDGDRIRLDLPHTDYQLRLKLGVPAASVTTAVGKRIRGAIEGRALRVHPAAGGGMFIEPVSGEPRIVAGVVVEVDRAARRLLIDVGVPIWLSTTPEQDFDVIREGELVNCYVESGTTFTPMN